MATQQGAHGIDAVTRFLDERGAGYEVIEHEQTFSAAEEARAAGVDVHDAAKTLALHDRDGYMLAVIPASMRLDLDKVRQLLDASTHLRLATEAEMEEEFGDFDVGALPPFGPMLPAPEIMDSRLLSHDRIVCAGGDHTHSLRIDPRELMRLADPKLGDICEAS